MSPEFRTIPVELSPELDRQLTEIAALREQSEQCTLQEAVREGLSVLESAPDSESALAIAALAEVVAGSRAGTIRKPLTVLG